jgi:hypothetical protein
MSALDQLTDRDLSEVFAVEVAGWELSYFNHRKHGRIAYKTPDEQQLGLGWEFPHFATSADAVLPFLDQCSHVKLERFRDGWWGYVSTPSFGKCDGPTTFARAACICLIDAKRGLTTS